MHFGSACAHLIGKTFFYNQDPPIIIFAAKRRIDQWWKLEIVLNQQEIKFWMSKIGPTVQKFCLFMCHKSNFVTFKDIIWLQINFLSSQEYIEPDIKKLWKFLWWHEPPNWTIVSAPTIEFWLKNWTFWLFSDHF